MKLVSPYRANTLVPEIPGQIIAVSWNRNADHLKYDERLIFWHIDDHQNYHFAVIAEAIRWYEPFQIPRHDAITASDDNIAGSLPGDDRREQSHYHTFQWYWPDLGATGAITMGIGIENNGISPRWEESADEEKSA